MMQPSGPTQGGGFVWKNGSFSKVNLGSAGCPYCTSINGISNSRVITGQAFRSGSWAGFLRAGKDNDFFKYKGGDTRFTGVNIKSDVLGFAVGGTVGFWAKSIELGEGTSDSTEVKPSFILVSFPGRKSTVPFAINDARAIVGVYTDSNGNQQGFLAK